MESLTFLIWPFLACIALILIHAYFGIHILERGIIFVDLAMAQFIGIGIALSFYLAYENHYILALLFAVLGSIIFAYARKFSEFIQLEAFIGVVYVFSFTIALIILAKSPHGSEEFSSILNGNILWVTPKDTAYAYLLYIGIGIFHYLLRKHFFAITFAGKRNSLMEFLFFLTFGFVLVKSVVMAGVLTVFSFLIIPALIGRLFTRKFNKTLAIGYTVGTLSTLIAIILSYKYDLPTSPLIAAIMSITFFGLLIFKTIRSKNLARGV
jgi:zinc/manganese transport system permease protein